MTLTFDDFDLDIRLGSVEVLAAEPPTTSTPPTIMAGTPYGIPTTQHC